MSAKEYRSIFVKTETRNKIKVQAVKLGFPSMIDYLEMIASSPINKLKEVLAEKS